MPRQFSSDWVSHHAADWLRWLAPWIGRPAVAALEIGSYEGRSAVWFCERVLTGPGSRLCCVDAWWHRQHQETFRANIAGLPICARQGNSREVLAQLTVEHRRYQWAYVDGDHSAAGTLADLCQVWHLLEPGGVLIADDYGWTSPDRPIPPQPAIDAFLACYADRIARHEIAHAQCAIWKPTR